MIDQIITNIYNNCKATAVPCISIPTQLFIFDILQKYKPKHYLEVWSANWYSLCYVANVINQWWWNATWFERWYPNRAYIKQHISLLRYYGLANAGCYYGSFLSRFGEISDRKRDMIFLDAQKSEYAMYLQLLLDQGAIDQETIIIVDDVIKYKDKMSDLYDMVSRPERSFEVHKLDEDDGVMILRWQK